MDIDIVLAFQALREAAGPAFTQIVNFITGIPLSPAVYLFPLVVYWLFDKAAGQLSLMSYAMSLCATGVVKNTACIDRPFNRDARITPPEECLEGAGGYSFPSGHSQITSSLFLSVGWYYRAKKWLFGLTIAFTLLIMFTRLYLGVHTPQDVLCGCALGILGIYLSNRLLRYLEREDARPTRVFVIGLVIGLAVILYLQFKPYPEEKSSSSLLSSWMSTVLPYWGILVGWYLEQCFVNFSSDAPVRDKLIRTLVSLVLTVVVYYVTGWLFGLVNPVAGMFVPTFFGAIAALWAGPAISELVIARVGE